MTYDVLLNKQNIWFDVTWHKTTVANQHYLFLSLILVCNSSNQPKSYRNTADSIISLYIYSRFSLNVRLSSLTTIKLLLLSFHLFLTCQEQKTTNNLPFKKLFYIEKKYSLLNRQLNIFKKNYCFSIINSVKGKTF